MRGYITLGEKVEGWEELRYSDIQIVSPILSYDSVLMVISLHGPTDEFLAVEQRESMRRWE